MNRIDHIVIAAQSLQQGVDYIQDQLCVLIPRGGEHRSMATHNRLMQLGNHAYLEVIAIDPQGKPPAHPRWFALDDARMRDSIKRQPRLITWVINTPDIQQLASQADFDIGQPTKLSRDDLSWEFALPDDGRLLGNGLLPYCIQWHSKPHPSQQMADLGCELEKITLEHNRIDWLAGKLNSIGAKELVELVEVADVESPRLSAVINSKKGRVVI